MKKVLFLIFIVCCYSSILIADSLTNVFLNDHQIVIDTNGNLTSPGEFVTSNQGQCDIMKYSPASYKLLEENFDNLDRWTQSGTITLTDNVVSLTSAYANLTMNIFDYQVFMPPIDRSFVMEATMTVATGNTGQISYFNTTPIALFQLNVSNTGISFLSVDTGIQFEAPVGFDSTKKIKIKILVDPLIGDAKVFVYYENTYSTILRLLTTFSFTYDVQDKPAYFRLESGATVGAVTYEKVNFYTVWGVGIGDSLLTGSPYYYPVPSMLQYEGNSFLLWLEKALDEKIYIDNQGIEGHIISYVTARYVNMVLLWKPEWVFLHIGSNDIKLDVPIATMKTDLETIVDACISNGSRVILFEVIPRGSDFTAAQNLVKNEWNIWLLEFTNNKENCVLIQDHDYFEDPSVPNALLPAYTSDTLHMNVRSSRILGNMVYQKITNWCNK